jgi:ABC-2 type transport system ATP-binding protein
MRTILKPEPGEEPDPTPVLSAEHLSFGYGRTPVLRDVSVSVSLGEFVALVGPNGSGKSTLLRLLLGTMSPQLGTVTLFGRPPADFRDRWRLGYVPQRPALGTAVPATVEEIVTSGRLRRGRWWRSPGAEDLAAVGHAIESVGLGELAGRPLGELSGGQQQRAFIARAFASEPDLLVLDEPTAGFDPEQRLRFREVVSQLPNRPTVLLSTHQTEDVTALCERVIVLAGGEVRFDGTPGELARTADGRVWIGEVRESGALLSWRTGDGRYRHIGQPPGGADLESPTVDDAYLLMVGQPTADAGAVA